MKKIILITILFLTSNLVNAQTKSGTPDYKNLTINYVSSNLRSPGSARYIEYSNPNETKLMLNNIGFNFSECTKITRLVVDSQNGFGALIRGFYFIFFKDGKPCHLETAESIVGNSAYGDKSEMLKVALRINNCDCTK